LSCGVHSQIRTTLLQATHACSCKAISGMVGGMSTLDRSPAASEHKMRREVTHLDPGARCHQTALLLRPPLQACRFIEWVPCSLVRTHSACNTDKGMQRPWGRGDVPCCFRLASQPGCCNVCLGAHAD
jgi:hypothetical protein